MAEGPPTRSNRKSFDSGPETVIAFVAETVVGATAGAVPPVAGYLQRVRDICDRHGVLLILDEVMCGSGRTGTFLSCEQDGVVPDIVTLGKGLGGGYQPIGAVVCTSEVYEAVARARARSSMARPTMRIRSAARLALAVQRVIRDEELLERVTEAGRALMELAEASASATHPNIGDIRGRGLLQAIELVADRDDQGPVRSGAARCTSAPRPKRSSVAC